MYSAEWTASALEFAVCPFNAKGVEGADRARATEWREKLLNHLDDVYNPMVGNIHLGKHQMKAVPVDYGSIPWWHCILLLALLLLAFLLLPAAAQIAPNHCSHLDASLAQLAPLWVQAKLVLRWNDSMSSCRNRRSLASNPSKFNWRQERVTPGVPVASQVISLSAMARTAELT